MPSKVSSLRVVPSAAAVIGSSTLQCRSSPRRVERVVVRDRHLDVEVAGRTGARADLALAGELDPGAGVDTGGDLELERAPGADPALAGALEARVGMTVPKPWQALHGRVVITWPRNERCTCWTSPRPLQTSQVRRAGARLGAAPWQVPQATAVSMVSSCSAPNTASARSMSRRTRASWPRR